MAKPGTIPTFSTSGTNVVAPSGGLRASGWLPATRPPAQVFNWLAKFTGDWLTWLDANSPNGPWPLTTYVDSQDAAEAAARAAAILTATQDVVLTNANQPVFGAHDDAHAHPSSGSNKWKLLMQCSITGGRHVGLYAGDHTGSGGGNFAIVTNAVWDAASAVQKWSQESVGDDSTILMIRDGEVDINRMPAGSAAWSSWNGSLGNLNVGENIGANTLHTFSHATVDGNVVLGGETNFASLKARTLEVGAAAWAGWKLTVNTSNDNIAVQFIENPILRLEFPTGSTLGSMDVLINKTATGTSTLKAMKRTGLNWSSPSIGSVTAVDTQTSSGSTGVKKITVDFGGLTVAAGETYFLMFVPDPTGSANGNDHIIAARINVSVPGLR